MTHSTTHTLNQSYQPLTHAHAIPLVAHVFAFKGLFFGEGSFGRGRRITQAGARERVQGFILTTIFQNACHNVTIVSYCDHAYAKGVRAVSLPVCGLWACVDGGGQQ